MTTKWKTLLATALLAAVGGGHADAETWNLVPDQSKIAFGSIKKDTVGEVSHFESISGLVQADGTVEIIIDLASVQTWIDIRNERMIEHVFGEAATATISAKLDMAEVSSLDVGETTIVSVTAQLSFGGATLDVDADLFMARLSETRVVAMTDEMLMVSTADLNIDAGVDTLQGLAKLSGITRVTPITLRLVFDLDPSQASAPVETAPAEIEMTFVGDPKAGKRAFRACAACHSLKPGDHRAGPSLHGVFGVAAGSQDGFSYSDALIGSGIVWTPETMAAFITKPKDLVPGTSMQYRGANNAKRVDDIIAYIAEETAE